MTNQNKGEKIMNCNSLKIQKAGKSRAESSVATAHPTAAELRSIIIKIKTEHPNDSLDLSVREIQCP